MDTLAQSSVTIVTTPPATLIAGTTTTLTTTGTTGFCINGKAYTKAALTNVATPTTDATTGTAFRPISANQGTVIVFGFDSGGNLKASQGTIEALNTSGNFVLAPQFPGIPSTMCPFGYLVAKGGSTLVATWTFGTNNLSSVTGMTYTFVIVSGMPDRPQVA